MTNSEVLTLCLHKKVFFGVDGGGFDFLNRVGKTKNADFFAVDDLDSFVRQTDDELNETLITNKLIAWLKG